MTHTLDIHVILSGWQVAADDPSGVRAVGFISYSFMAATLTSYSAAFTSLLAIEEDISNFLVSVGAEISIIRAYLVLPYLK